MKCPNCKTENQENAIYCQECGTKFVESGIIQYGYLQGETFEPKKNEKELWPTQLAFYLGIWGVINLVLFAPGIGVILIFFAVLIYASKSFKAIYTFGIIWLLVALIQLSIWAYYPTGDYPLFFLAFINLAFGGYAIYNTKKLERG